MTHRPHTPGWILLAALALGGVSCELSTENPARIRTYPPLAAALSDGLLLEVEEGESVELEVDRPPDGHEAAERDDGWVDLNELLGDPE